MSTLSGKHILVVDDEAELREILLDEFKFYGAEVIGAENGKQAFKILQNQKIDVVISDVRMPGGDGLWLLREIHEKMPATAPKLFLCSGFSDIDPAQAKKYGVIESFGKPFNRDHVISSVEKALKK